jgi:cation transport ATPase
MYRFWIRSLQFLSIFFMWSFAAGILVFVPWLVFVAARWNDALNWSVAISVVMTPVYLIVAATLTYVFIGLRRGAPKEGE